MKLNILKRLLSRNLTAEMSTNLLTCFKFDHRPLFFSQKATDKIVIIYLAQKANSLTVLPTGTGQSGLQRYLTHFMLHQPTYRKQQFRNPALAIPGGNQSDAIRTAAMSTLRRGKRNNGTYSGNRKRCSQ